MHNPGVRPISAMLLMLLLAGAATGAEQEIRVADDADRITIDTEALSATIVKKDYVSGIKAGTFVDKKTSAHDLGFGLHIQDWLMAPGWRDDGYLHDPAVHGNLPKHIVEGPQLCTQAKRVDARIIRGNGFVAVKLTHTYTEAGTGYKPGSKWEQTLLFTPKERYFFSCEQITSANDVDDLFYRLDMPGHIRHKAGDTFEQIYLSYLDKPIAASEFLQDFAPDAKFFYQRRDDAIPARMIRAYQVKLDAKPGPWLAGMTLDPAEVCEAWCHQRGYICFIEELHRRHVKAGETFGAAYIIGWFDDVAQMQKTYDAHRGASRIVVDESGFKLE